MEYAALVEIIGRLAVLALQTYDNSQKKDLVKPEEIEALRKLAAQTPVTQMRDAILRAGLNPDDEHVKNLLALVTPK